MFEILKKFRVCWPSSWIWGRVEGGWGGVDLWGVCFIGGTKR